MLQSTRLPKSCHLALPPRGKVVISWRAGALFKHLSSWYICIQKPHNASLTFYEFIEAVRTRCSLNVYSGHLFCISIVRMCPWIKCIFSRVTMEHARRLYACRQQYGHLQLASRCFCRFFNCRFWESSTQCVHHTDWRPPNRMSHLQVIFLEYGNSECWTVEQLSNVEWVALVRRPSIGGRRPELSFWLTFRRHCLIVAHKEGIQLSLAVTVSLGRRALIIVEWQ